MFLKNRSTDFQMSILLLRPCTLKALAPLRSIRNLHLTCLRTQKVKSSAALTQAKEKYEISQDVKPMGERIKENTKTASYMGIILVGVGVTGVLFYAIFRELFSSNSSNGVYSDALDKVKDDPRVQDALGAPIKGFGEENRRGRRRHVAHSVYEKDGRKFMRMQFYIQGIRNKGTVHLEMRENLATGKFEYRYLFVQLDYYPHSTIVLEDNRASDAVQMPQTSSGFL